MARRRPNTELEPTRPPHAEAALTESAPPATGSPAPAGDLSVAPVPERRAAPAYHLAWLPRQGFDAAAAHLAGSGWELFLALPRDRGPLEPGYDTFWRRKA